MATLSVRLDLHVFQLKTYKIILKVKKFQLPTYCCFSTAGGNVAVGGFRPPLGLIGLNAYSSLPGFSLKMHTRLRNFLSFSGVFEALFAKNLMLCTIWMEW